MFSFADANFVVLAFSSLFSVINPIEAAPLFVSLTRGMESRRKELAFRASIAAALILAVFALAGGAIFSFFGITLPAFQIAGGILFTSIGLSTLRFDDRAERAEEAEEADSASKADPSIVPLGMPLIAGPGAISTVMVLVGQARDGGHRAALAIAIAANILLTLAHPARRADAGAPDRRDRSAHRFEDHGPDHGRHRRAVRPERSRDRRARDPEVGTLNAGQNLY